MYPNIFINDYDLFVKTHMNKFTCFLSEAYASGPL